MREYIVQGDLKRGMYVEYDLYRVILEKSKRKKVKRKKKRVKERN